MKKPKTTPTRGRRARRAVCEDVRFIEVEFPRPIHPRLVVEFSGGLSLLIEDSAAIDLAAKFIDAFRELEARGGAR